MKKIFTQFLVIAIFPTIGVAQITITQADMPALYSTWVDHQDTSTHAAITPAGPNQTWDYSTFTANETNVTNLQPLTATNSAWNANFPTSQMVHYSTSDSMAFYYSTDAAGFYFDGFYSNRADEVVPFISYQSKLMIVPTPFTYQNTTSNTAKVSMEMDQGQGLFVKMVTYTHTDFECDAYGSMTTPAGTFPNTLRIKTIEYNYDTTYIDFGAGAGYQMYDYSEPNDTSIKYRWIQNGTNALVFYVSEQMNGTVGSGIIEHATYYEVTPAGPPNAPTNLTVDPTLRLTVYDKMQLTWSDNSNNELGFYVERSLDSNSWSTIATLNTDEVSYLDQGLSPSTIYYYRVSAFNNIGSSNYSNTVTGNTDGTTAINNNLTKEKITIYPNPTKNAVFIQFEKNTISTVELYDVVGKKLITEQTQETTHQLDMSNYPNGVYFLKVNNETTKIIKQ